MVTPWLWGKDVWYYQWSLQHQIEALIYIIRGHEITS